MTFTQISFVINTIQYKFKRKDLISKDGTTIEVKFVSHPTGPIVILVL